MAVVKKMTPEQKREELLWMILTAVFVGLFGAGLIFMGSESSPNEWRGTNPNIEESPE